MRSGAGSGEGGLQAESQKGVQGSPAPRSLGRVCLPSLLPIAAVCQACHFMFLLTAHKMQLHGPSLPHGAHHRLPGLTPFLFRACFSTSLLPFAAFPFQPQKRFSAGLHSLSAKPELLGLGAWSPPLGLVLRYKRQQLCSISRNRIIIKPAVALGHEFQRFLLHQDLDLKRNQSSEGFLLASEETMLRIVSQGHSIIPAPSAPSHHMACL